MKVGDLVVHRDGWEGFLFVITEIVERHEDEQWFRCAIVRTPNTDKGYEIGYTIRWKAHFEWELYKK